MTSCPVTVSPCAASMFDTRPSCRRRWSRPMLPALVTMPVSTRKHRADDRSVGPGADTDDHARNLAGLGDDGPGVGGDSHHARTSCPSNVKGFRRPASRPGFPLQSRCARIPLQSLTPPRAFARSALSLGRRLAALPAVAGPTRPMLYSTAPRAASTCPPRNGAERRARQRLASLALAGCADCGHRLGSSRQHSVRCRCRLRRPPARALRRALPAAQAPQWLR